jgi:hypothetical protein
MTLTLLALFSLALLSLACAAIPAGMFLANRKLFLPPGPLEPSAHGPRAVSLLIPARNEAAGIEAAIHAAFASVGVELEVIVLDDHSTDATAELVTAIAAQDSRVKLLRGNELLAGWNGKQHACYQLAGAATHANMVFVDADVRLSPDALARLIDHKQQTGVALLSAFPSQITGTWSEKWLITLMHYILLGFLPLARMRASADPAFAAGCGQLFLTRRDDYQLAGTHEAIRASRHDGLKLPRVYRARGLSTDVVDGTELAQCRMYTSAPEVFRGLLKNATEGIANPRLIVPFTIMLIGGSVLPWVTAAIAIYQDNLIALAISIAAIAASHLPRTLAAIQFRQSWQGVIFHAPSILLFIALQWQAALMQCLGKQVTWRGRK